MKRICCLLLLTLLSFTFVCSCIKGEPDMTGLELSLSPGECLRSNTLKIQEQNGFLIHSGNYAGLGIRVRLDFDANNMDRVIVSKTKNGIPGVYRLCPNDDTFNAFGNDSNEVKESYYSILNCVLTTNKLVPLTTVYSDGAFSLRANKTFAGIEAGEELSGLSYLAEVKFNPYSSIFPINPPEGMAPLPRSIEIIIPLNDREIIDDTVVMHVEIPVKVGMLLHTLQVRLTDPEAPMQYRDEVLTGDFAIPKNLK